MQECGTDGQCRESAGRGELERGRWHEGDGDGEPEARPETGARRCGKGGRGSAVGRSIMDPGGHDGPVTGVATSLPIFEWAAIAAAVRAWHGDELVERYGDVP